MRVLLFGSQGLLGTTMRAVAEKDPRVDEVIAMRRKDVDVTDREQVRWILRETRPDACINTAALMPADLCDETPDEAYAVHTLGARWISRACAEVGAVPVYISTDFVFDGLGGRTYRTGDLPRPAQTYGIAKIAGEAETRLGSERHLIARTACLFGPPPENPARRSCFVDRVVKRAAAGEELTVVDNVVMSPTYTVDLAAALLDLLHHDAAPGIYHATNAGSTSWYELCCTALALLGIDAPVARTQEQLFTAAPRPLHTPLVVELPAFVQGIRRPWTSALAHYLKDHRV